MAPRWRALSLLRERQGHNTSKEQGDIEFSRKIYFIVVRGGAWSVESRVVSVAGARTHIPPFFSPALRAAFA